MPVNIQEVIDAVAHVSAEKNLRCAMKESLKGGLITGTSAAVGGLLLGPIGLFIGGALGGGTSSILFSKKFKPVCIILQEMSFEQKKLLYEKIQYAFRNVGVQDLTAMAMLILSTTKFQDIAIETVTDYLMKELSLKVVN